MKYRILGKTDLKTSVIGMGTWQFGGEWGKDFTQDEVTAMFRRALELGVNLIDTAECYGDHLSERLIGEAIRTLNARDRFILATKCGHHFVKPFERTEPRRPVDIQDQLEDSLKALQTDHIDLYQYHTWGDDHFFDQDVRDVLDRARQAGKILHIGNSIAPNHKTSQVEVSEDFNVGCIQIVYNRLAREPEDTVFPVCERLKLGVLARVPLASGFLSGKYKPGTKFGANDARSHWGAKSADWRLREVQKIAASEVPEGVPMARWALAWCLLKPAVQCVIPGCKSLAQLEDNAAAADLAMVDPEHPWAAKEEAA